MHKNNYLYTFIYDKTEGDLCKLESKYIFNQEEKNKLLFSDIKVEPSSSAFIKRRLDVILYSEDFSSLIDEIKRGRIGIEGFKVEYFVLDGDTTEYPERLIKLRDIGYAIDCYPDYYKPTITYGLCYYKGIWYFGVLVKSDYTTQKHKQKPRSSSSSIGVSIAKALVNIASKANKEIKLIDACCGVGTIMLEACFAGNNIEGCDINGKTCEHVRENLSHFNYTANVYHSDIKDISKRYEAAIIDLPYNMFSNASDNDILHIIESTAEISDRLIIVSTSDITNIVHNTGFRISDYCSVNKRGKAVFGRKIWVCEKSF